MLEYTRAKAGHRRPIKRLICSTLMVAAALGGTSLLAEEPEALRVWAVTRETFN
jgi:hypothetical protein